MFESFKANKRFGALDGLRCFSILLVIWHHTAPVWVSEQWVTPGFHGVTLFFAISGFLITTLMLRERDMHGRLNLRNFYIRRSLRIFPLYFVVLGMYLALVLFVESDGVRKEQFLSNLKYFATYTSNIFVELSDGTIFYFAWSLATEEQFYLIWPFLFLTLKTPRQLLTTVGAFLIGLIVRDLVGSPVPYVPIAIVGGVFLACCLHDESAFEKVQRWLGSTLSAPTAFALLLAALAFPQLPDCFVSIACVVFLASTVIREDHLFRGPLGIGWIAYLGKISYGLYLLHMLSKNVVTKVIDKIGFAVPDIFVFPLTVLVAVVAATFSWKYLEAWFLKLKNNFSSRNKPAPESQSRNWHKKSDWMPS